MASSYPLCKRCGCATYPDQNPLTDHLDHVAEPEPTPAQQPDGGAEPTQRGTGSPCNALDHDWLVLVFCSKCPEEFNDEQRIVALMREGKLGHPCSACAPTPPASPEREAVYRAVDRVIELRAGLYGTRTKIEFVARHDAAAALNDAIDVAAKAAARKESTDAR